MGHLKSNRTGWNKLKRKLQAFGVERSIDVGFFSDKKYGSDNDNLPVATVAMWNDQGTPLVPPRPFMTIDFERYVTRAGNMFVRQVFFTLLHKNLSEANAELKKAGAQLKNQLQFFIIDYPGSNSPAWAEHKGFNDPLMYTGVLASSVGFRVRSSTGKVTSRG